MQQTKKKGAVIKGLAFPIGYTVFMNAFGSVIIGLIAVFCYIRVFLPFLISPDAMGAEALQNIYLTDYANTVTNLTYLISAITTVAALLILWLIFNRKGRNFVEYFHFKRTSFKAILTAVLMGLSLFFIVSGVMTVLSIAASWLIEQCYPILVDAFPEYAEDLQWLYELYYEMMNTSVGDNSMFIIAAIFGAPLIEELVFRAGPLTNLTNRMRPLPAIMITSALFSLAHGSPAQMVYTFVLGIVMGYLFVKTDSIYPCIVCHFVFNGANLISLLMGELFNSSAWHDHPSFEPHVDEVLATISEVTFWAYLVLSVLIAIPMLIVGIILLISLRRPAPEAPAPEQATAPAGKPITEPVAQTVIEPVQDYGIDPTVDPTAELPAELPEETIPVEQMVEALDTSDDITDEAAPEEQADAKPSGETEETV